MKVKKTLVSFLIGLLLSGLIMCSRGIFSAVSSKQALLCACDGFSVSGVLFLCFAAMVRIAGEGSFDILGYAIQKGLHHLIPGRFGEDYGNFYDYKTRKQERKGELHLSIIFLTGFVLLAIGLLMTGVWYKLP